MWKSFLWKTSEIWSVVTEGEDKPLKYPLAFRNSQLCIISKTDLLPYLDVSLRKIKSNIKSVNPQMEIIELSAKTGKGLKQWIEFLSSSRKKILRLP